MNKIFIKSKYNQPAKKILLVKFAVASSALVRACLPAGRNGG